MKRLIVNADDYGHSPATSAGIRKAHLEGIVTTATTMMNLPDALPALHKAREETPNLGVGVHLVITHGMPVLGESVPSLVGQNGLFPDLPDYYQRGSTFDAGQVKAEWRAQIEKFLQSGLTIDHIDSHHHAAYMFESTLRILFDLAEEYDAPIRHPFAGLVMYEGDEQANVRRFATQLMERSLVRYPDCVNCDFYDETVNLETLLGIIESLPDGTTELMTHPALMDDELMATSTYNTMRVKELELLTDPRVRAKICECGVELITFRQL